MFDIVIKYENKKEEWHDIYVYIHKEKIKLSNIRVLALSILGGIGLYMVIDTLFDYWYKIIFSCIFSVFLCIIGFIIYNRQLYRTIEYITDIDEKEVFIDNEYIEINKKGTNIRIKKNSNYKLLDINSKLILLDKNNNIIFIIPNNVFKDITKKEEFLSKFSMLS